MGVAPRLNGHVRTPPPPTAYGVSSFWCRHLPPPVDPAMHAIGTRARVRGVGGATCRRRHRRMHVGGGAGRRVRGRLRTGGVALAHAEKVTPPPPPRRKLTKAADLEHPLSCSSRRGWQARRPCAASRGTKHSVNTRLLPLEKMPREEESTRPDADKCRMHCHTIAPFTTKLCLVRDALRQTGHRRTTPPAASGVPAIWNRHSWWILRHTQRGGVGKGGRG
jgi:hypothetical protein